MDSRLGLTRLEILIAVVGCLFAAGFGVMFIARHRENALRMQCLNNLRHLGIAFNAYQDASSTIKALKRLPPSRIADGYATWAVLLAPYVVKDHPLGKSNQQVAYFVQDAEVREARLIHYFCPA